MKKSALLNVLGTAFCTAACVTKTVTELAVQVVTVTSKATKAETAPGLPPPPAINSPVFVPSPAPSAVSSGAHASAQATFNPLPEAAIAKSETPSMFALLQAQPGMAMIVNSCDYDIYLNSKGCGDGVLNHLIAPGDTFTEPIRACAHAGVALHVTSKDHPKPVMVEYSAEEPDPASSKRKLFYDLSFLDCMVEGSTDLTGCAGWKYGHQCKGGKGTTVWSCLPEEYCDRTSYTVKEYGQNDANKAVRIKVAAPVAVTDFNDGVVWELCAAKRHA